MHNTFNARALNCALVELSREGTPAMQGSLSLNDLAQEDSLMSSEAGVLRTYVSPMFISPEYAKCMVQNVAGLSSDLSEDSSHYLFPKASADTHAAANSTQDGSRRVSLETESDGKTRVLTSRRSSKESSGGSGRVVRLEFEQQLNLSSNTEQKSESSASEDTKGAEKSVKPTASNTEQASESSSSSEQTQGTEKLQQTKRSEKSDQVSGAEKPELSKGGEKPAKILSEKPPVHPSKSLTERTSSATGSTEDIVLKKSSSFAGFQNEQTQDNLKRQESLAVLPALPGKMVPQLPSLGRLRHSSAPSGQGTPRSKASTLPQTPSWISSRGSYTEEGKHVL